MADPTWSTYCDRCGHTTIGFEEDAERGKMGCSMCGKALTLPYFSDGQLKFMLICLILGPLTLLALMLLTQR